MRRFLKDLLVFLIPVIIVMCVVWTMGIYSGEAIHPRIIAQLQANSCDYIYGKSHLASRVAYRMAQLDYTQAEVFIVGSSRSVHFRDQFLDDPDKFFNISLPGTKTESVASFVEQIIKRSSNVKVILVEVEPTIFNSRIASDVALRLEDYMDLYDPMESENVVKYLSENSNYLVQQLILRDLSLETIFLKEPNSKIQNNLDGVIPLGIEAIYSRTGFRCDGSIMESPIIIQEATSDRELALQHIEANVGLIQTGDTIEPMRFTYIEQLLQRVQQEQIQIIGYTMPYEPQIHEIMVTTGDYSFIDIAIQGIEALFDEYGFPYANLSDPTMIGAESEMFYDAEHPSELATLLSYIELLDRYPEILGDYSDIDRLRSVANNVQDPFRVFPPFSTYLQDEITTQSKPLAESEDSEKAKS